MDSISTDFDWDAWGSAWEDVAATSAKKGIFAAAAGTLIFFVIVGLVVAAIMIASWWKIFVKAGKPGWAAIVPFYNFWILFEIVGLPGWLAFAAIVPFIGPAIVGVLNIIAAIKLAPLFGKETIFAVGLIFLPIVFYPMLAFGKAEYVGEGATATSSEAPTSPE